MGGLQLALYELGGFIVLIGLARLAALYEASRSHGAKPSELVGLMGARHDSDDDDDDAERCAQPRTPEHISISCWPSRGRREEEDYKYTDPDELDD